MEPFKSSMHFMLVHQQMRKTIDEGRRDDLSAARNVAIAKKSLAAL